VPKRYWKKGGRKVLLVDIIAKPIEGVETTLYNPYELREYPSIILLRYRQGVQREITGVSQQIS